ncbi:MAG: helix-turn-helix domain-containing protein [Ignavibacteriales bacterium]
MAKSLETKAKFVELRAKGHSYDRISKELNTSKQTLIDWSKEFETEIADLKRIELESLHETVLIIQRQQIELLVEFLKKVNTELETGDLKDVSTDKLLLMFLKCLSVLNESPEPLARQRVALELRALVKRN